MYIALRLLRDGAHTTITTRFPKDAARRFASMPDSGDWLDRLSIVGVDLRQPGQVVALADAVAADGPLDILINNAAQTVRRSPDAYALLVAGEADALPAVPQVRELGAAHDRHPVTTLALSARSTAVDAGGLAPDEVDHNSWTQRVEEIDPVEMLEVQLCNTTAPFILISRLRASLAASTARRTYVVTDERPHPTRLRLAGEGFHAPLDLSDGAARVYDPIVRGETGEDLFGVFLKDYAPASW